MLGEQVVLKAELTAESQQTSNPETSSHPYEYRGSDGNTVTSTHCKLKHKLTVCSQPYTLDRNVSFLNLTFLFSVWEEK